MKKATFILFLYFFLSFMGYGSSLSIYNGTPATFTFQIQVYSANGVPSCSGTLIIPPGLTAFNSPLDVPSLAGCAQATDNFALIGGFCNPYDISLLNPAIFGGTGQESVGTPNGCVTYPFQLIWSPNGLSLAII